MASRYNEVSDLIKQGNLSLYLFPSNLREGSEITAQLLKQSPDIHATVQAEMMNKKYDSDSIYDRIMERYEQLSKNDTVPVGILVKDHSVFISDQKWDELATIAKRIIFLLRDPVSQFASLIDLMLKDELTLSYAICAKRKLAYTSDREAIEKAAPVLSEIAARKGFGSWEKMITTLKSQEDFYPLADFFDEFFPKANKPTNEYPNGHTYRYMHPFDAVVQSARKNAERIESVGDKAIVIDFSTLQMNPKFSRELCEGAGLAHNEVMVTGGKDWLTRDLSKEPNLGSEEKNARRALAVGEAAKSRHIKPTSRKTIASGGLIPLAQEYVAEGLEHYVVMHMRDSTIKHKTADELKLFVFGDVQNPAQQATEEKYMFAYLNPVTAYTIVRTSDLDVRNTRGLIEGIIQMRPDCTELYQKIDNVMSAIKGVVASPKPLRREQG